jgi:4-aminobutyrate aminotransferase-like enzyme
MGAGFSTCPVASVSLRSVTGIPSLVKRSSVRAARCVHALGDLEKGVIVVPAGLDGDLISATPPLTICDEEIDEALELLA